MVATSWYLIVFRLIHIVAGTAWAGSVFLFVFFLQPSAAAIGPAAAPMMGELLARRRLVTVLLWLAGTTIVAGGFLYWHSWDAAGSLGDWIGTRYGLGLTIGAIAAIGAFAIGFFGTRPTVNRMLALSRTAAASEGPPPPEVAAEIGEIQGKLKLYARSALALIGIAVLTMATARYW
jgi:hypothetical protein